METINIIFEMLRFTRKQDGQEFSGKVTRIAWHNDGGATVAIIDSKSHNAILLRFNEGKWSQTSFENLSDFQEGILAVGRRDGWRALGGPSE